MNIPSPTQDPTVHSTTARNFQHIGIIPASMLSHKTTSLFDRIGIAISGICAVHCLILPLLLPFMGAIAAQFESEWTHTILAALIIPTVLFTAWRGYKHHGKQEVIWLLGIGAFAVVAALLVGHHAANENVETAVTTLGSFLLITGHWQNHKHCALCVGGKPHAH